MKNDWSSEMRLTKAGGFFLALGSGVFLDKGCGETEVVESPEVSPLGGAEEVESPEMKLVVELGR